MFGPQKIMIILKERKNMPQPCVLWLTDIFLSIVSEILTNLQNFNLHQLKTIEMLGIIELKLVVNTLIRRKLTF